MPADLTKEQRDRLDEGIRFLRERQESGAATSGAGNGGESSRSPRAPSSAQNQKIMVSFYAAAIGVMFLLFTASGAAGALLDEAESGTLDRVLSSRVTMTSLMLGKAGLQLAARVCAIVRDVSMGMGGIQARFLVAHSRLHRDGRMHGGRRGRVWHVAGQYLSSPARNSARFPRWSFSSCPQSAAACFRAILMPEAMQKAGLFTINAWAIDGFTKMFWRDEPISQLWPQVLVLLAIAVVLFAIARRVARRWEYA